MRRKVPEGYTMKIKHYRDTNKIIDDREDSVLIKTPIIAVTEATLLKGETVVAKGIARCSASDQFNKRKGRLIAEQRALHFFELNN